MNNIKSQLVCYLFFKFLLFKDNPIFNHFKGLTDLVLEFLPGNWSVVGLIPSRVKPNPIAFLLLGWTWKVRSANDSWARHCCCPPTITVIATLHIGLDTQPLTGSQRRKNNTQWLYVLINKWQGHLRFYTLCSELYWVSHCLNVGHSLSCSSGTSKDFTLPVLL